MQSSSKLLSQETSDTNASEALETLSSISEYEKQMIEKYQSESEYGTLRIQWNPDLKSLNFINTLKVNYLFLYDCKNIVPQLESLNIVTLNISQCQIQSVKGFQLENLEVLTIQHSLIGKLESKTLAQEIIQFKKLKELTLQICITDFSPLSQLIGLTKLSLIQCELRSTEALRQFVNLEELSLNGNGNIDITTLQYLTNLTKLSFLSCKLKSLDALRPLKKLKVLNITWNSVIYIEPLMELKQLSIFASNNKIINTKSIQQHPNFNQFKLDNQEQPTKEELKTANMMRNINSPITSLKQIYQQSSRIKHQYFSFRQNITQQLQQSYNYHVQFVARVAILFQKINELDCQ
ncbi:Conserved_hypothetical protein [Hexamita inflata]|uniref:Uncharacterized protein n=1 Tax=Hexamita inflata TaxID=28002 RepID=A0AA86NVJ7_9EUKA|nr:Conserved hypothetical protein [Hexamita inflata]